MRRSARPAGIARNPALRIDEFIAALDQIRSGFPCRGIEVSEVFRRGGVVGIHDRDPFAGSLSKSGIQRRGLSPVRLFNQPDVRETRRITPQDLTGTVGRAVVDCNDFKTPEGLCFEGVKRFRQILFRVADRKENGYGGDGIHQPRTRSPKSVMAVACLI